MKAPELISARLTYVPLGLSHLSSDYVNWMNDPDVNMYLETGGDYALNDLKKYLTEVETKPILFWGIHIKESNKHIGNIKIDPVNARHGLGEYGIMMGDKKEWGKGYAFEASNTILDYCFSQVGLRKITLGVVEDNTAAVSLYKRLGFVVEGFYKEHGFYNGKLCNQFRMAIFKNMRQKLV